MLRRKSTEIHVNQERWLVSYADFITLLFAFFVVMYSISQVNESKYRVLSNTFEHAFKSTTPTQAPVDSTPVDTSVLVEASLNPIQVGEPARPLAIDLGGQPTGQSEQTQDAFAEISELFSERFGDLIRDQLVKVSSNELWLQIELKDSILFSSGSAEPSLQAQTIFDEIALILKDYPNPVQVEGYTDNLPINSPRYPSNWELSTARASAIVKWLAGRGVEPRRLSAVGFGEFQPIADNATAEGRAQNRRVVLMIARKALARPGLPLAQASPSGAAIPSPAKTQADTLVPPVVDAAPQASPPAAGAAETAQDPATPNEVVPVELENGGLLFTSDPEIQRNR